MDKLPLKDDRQLVFGERTLVMGIVNVTPDSFYPASRSPDLSHVIAHVERMVESGVDIIDIGGESTRPGSSFIDADEELARVVPAVREIRRRFSVPISIDTRRAVVAAAALDHGADLINDITALRDDAALAHVVAEHDAPIVLMHIRGTPETMQRDVHYVDTMGEIVAELRSRVEYAVSQGINRRRILLDPGIGFGKRVEDNLRIIRDIPRLLSLGFPVVVGASRKGFIGAVLGSSETPVAVEGRLFGSLAAAAYAATSGAHVVRVHDVQETVHVVRLIDAVKTVRPETNGELAQ